MRVALGAIKGMSYELRHEAAPIRVEGGDAALSEDEPICTQLVCGVGVLATGLLELFGVGYVQAHGNTHPPGSCLHPQPHAMGSPEQAGGPEC